MLELVQKCAQGAPEVRVQGDIPTTPAHCVVQVLDGDHEEQIGDRQRGRELMTEVATKSIVLLKNEDGLLPLKPKVGCCMTSVLTGTDGVYRSRA